MKRGKRKKVSSFVNNLCCCVFRLKASSWHIWRRFQRWRTRFISNPCCITFALWWLRTSLRARTSTLRLAPLHALQRYNVLKHILKSFKRRKTKICGAVRLPLISSSLMSGGFRPAAGESMSDGATLQSLLGPPEGHRQARDEAPAKAEDVWLPERLRWEDHHPQNCSPQDYQQVGFKDLTVRTSLETLSNTFYVCGVPPGSTPSCCTSVIRPTVWETSASTGLVKSSASLHWSTGPPVTVCCSRNRNELTTANATRPEGRWLWMSMLLWASHTSSQKHTHF